MWRNLLVGAQSSNQALTPEGKVAASEAALSRTARIIRRIVLHYWLALFILAIATAGIIYTSIKYLGGAAKVWTEIVTTAGSLGVTARGLSNGVVRITEAGEAPIYRAEVVDAVAWQVTTLPRVKLNNRGVRALRRAGIQGTSSLGRI